MPPFQQHNPSATLLQARHSTVGGPGVSGPPHDALMVSGQPHDARMVNGVSLAGVSLDRFRLAPNEKHRMNFCVAWRPRK